MISLTRTKRVPYAIALGGVPVGTMKSKETAIPASNASDFTGTPKTGANGNNKGNKIAAPAVLGTNAVKKTMNKPTRIKVKKTGWPATVLANNPAIATSSWDALIAAPMLNPPPTKTRESQPILRKSSASRNHIAKKANTGNNATSEL